MKLREFQTPSNSAEDANCNTWSNGRATLTLENHWVDKDDVFADKALQEFKSLNPALKVHIRHLHISEDHIITPTDKYMTSPTPSVKNLTAVFFCSTGASLSTLNRVGTSAGLIQETATTSGQGIGPGTR